MRFDLAAGPAGAAAAGRLAELLRAAGHEVRALPCARGGFAGLALDALARFRAGGAEACLLLGDYADGLAAAANRLPALRAAAPRSAADAAAARSRLEARVLALDAAAQPDRLCELACAFAAAPLPGRADWAEIDALGDLEAGAGRRGCC